MRREMRRCACSPGNLNDGKGYSRQRTEKTRGCGSIMPCNILDRLGRGAEDSCFPFPGHHAGREEMHHILVGKLPSSESETMRDSKCGARRRFGLCVFILRTVVLVRTTLSREEGPCTPQNAHSFEVSIRLTHLASKPVFILPSLPCDRPLSRSQPSCPSRRAPILTAEDMRIAQVSSADATSVRRFEKPVAPRSTCRTRPLATRASVWTTSLLGKEFYCI